MKKFIEKHKDTIHGVLTCVDRVIFKGYNFFSNSTSMEKILRHKGILIKDFSEYPKKQSKIIKYHAYQTAQKYNRPYIPPKGKYNKEYYAKTIAVKDNATNGLVCVLNDMELSLTFKYNF